MLILEIPNTKTDIYNYWVNILRPTHILNISQSVDFTAKSELVHFLYVLFSTKFKQYALDREFISKQVEKLNLPSSKLKILKGVNNRTIIDNTHYYYPISLTAALEVANTFEGRKILFHDETETYNLENWLINPKNYMPQKGDVILLRGQKTKMQLYVKKLIGATS